MDSNCYSVATAGKRKLSFVLSGAYVSSHMNGKQIFRTLSAGIMFSMIAIESDSVWNSGIVHAIWNIIMIGGDWRLDKKRINFLS